MSRIHEAIARRAFEMFEGDRRLFGRELDHWFTTEAELLHPVHVQISEFDDAVKVQAEVPRFSPEELEGSVELSEEYKKAETSGDRLAGGSGAGRTTATLKTAFSN